jgi:DNA-binding SARP family transcriptional activator
VIHISLLGFPQVIDLRRQLVLTDFQGVKPRQVLYLLALNGGRPLPKERLADLLWDGHVPQSWCSTLEGYVSLLRRSLQDGVSARDSAVQTRNGGYVLAPGLVDVDIERFAELTGQAAAQPPRLARESLRAALGLVRGVILEGERCRSWVLDARSQWLLRIQQTAIEAGRLSMLLDDPASAVEFGKYACELDPLAEDAWALVIEGYWRSDRRTDALRSYSRLRALLDRELGIGPRQRLQRIYVEMLRDDELSVPA